MALFGSINDIGFFKMVNNEIISDIIEQNVGYYKLNLEETKADMYGDSIHKVWNDPVLIPCIINHGEFTTVNESSTTNVTRQLSVFFLKTILEEHGIYPERGDFILWNEDEFELRIVNENTYVSGKLPEYNYSEPYLDNFGGSLSIECVFTYVSPEKSNLKSARI